MHGLPVNPNPILTLPNQYASAIHHTAAHWLKFKGGTQLVVINVMQIWPKFNLPPFFTHKLYSTGIRSPVPWRRERKSTDLSVRPRRPTHYLPLLLCQNSYFIYNLYQILTLVHGKGRVLLSRTCTFPC